ncbi:hypothetical protein, partial [Pseudomonas sp. F1002]|uniref:hypothetical protein n=1 Tax=Pseudomonas sp. F1002 TaxID=2738821 RepID=UPI001C433AD6
NNHHLFPGQVTLQFGNVSITALGVYPPSSLMVLGRKACVNLIFSGFPPDLTSLSTADTSAHAPAEFLQKLVNSPIFTPSLLST